ncbi:serine/threonine protein kinase [Pilibacter termitis]|uniref:Serine/threonine protein kinase n=1 Tax=Pilibacter termitis TaxID=263852 RepID=A0A1T4M3B0_9ENTE|nr:PASTA domain-containing protein [Pilibacter termitis]SJZ61479.1 serine/threonine protein kinase [Pilibacter termitis]
MSDFLSNFSGDKYQKSQPKPNTSEKKKTPEPKPEPVKEEKKETTKEEKLPVQKGSRLEQIRNKISSSIEEFEHQEAQTQEKTVEPKKQLAKKHVAEEEKEFTSPDELYEKDPDYHNKRKKKFILIGVVSALLILLLSIAIYNMTHVNVPNFTGKDLSTAREWAVENGVKIDVKQKYDFDIEVNKVISQSIKEKKIKKGNTLNVTASLGPDEKEKIKLPDFAILTLSDAKKWIEKQKADNVTIVENYSETVEKNKYLRMDFPDKEVTAENYRRRDRLNVYYSKGKEVYQKDITVPNFAGKPVEEVDDWAKKNEIVVAKEEKPSDKVEVKKVISQSVAANEKMAKKEKLTITLSLGKAVKVPDFSGLTVAEAEEYQGAFETVIKRVYHDNVAYGHLISQSVEADKEYYEGQGKPKITLSYSLGKPYLKDLRESTQEGDLAKFFYEEFESKGANVTFSTYYVNSDKPKGTVVAMSRFSEFIPTKYNVSIGISLGNIKN